MTLVRQIGLISAGCQPWNLNVVDASGSRFAYAATLAIYIYEWNSESNQFYLHSIMSEHKKTITSIAWHLKDTDILASSSADFKICIWHIAKHKLVASLTTPHAVPSLMAWFPSDDDCLAYWDGKGPLYLWKFLLADDRDEPSSYPLKEIASISSNVTQINWHKSAVGRFAIGHADGTLSFYIQGKKPQKHIKLPCEKSEDSVQINSISSLQWDPFSSNYLLVCTMNGHLYLMDVSTEVASVITTYHLPSKAVSIKCVAWLTEAPGCFVTGDAETGVLRIWTVSKEKPQESFRLKQAGFKALCVLPSEDTSTTNKTGKIKFISRIVCLFFDGGVGVYNLCNSTWDFLRDMGHLETIFDCQFKPDHSDLLATASFDGTIKVWNVDTMEAVNSSRGDSSIIYSLSWAPGTINRLAAATSKSGIFIWDVEKGSLKRIENHQKGTYIYCVSWNQKDSRKIASAGGDGTCMIHQTDGKLIQTFKHPAPVYGCDWNPNNENIVATACEDSIVRVFYVGSGTVQPLKELSGHEGKVFRVKWSPLKDGIICSTSDDCSVRVWHYARGVAIRVLKGHTSYTRGLLWCPELPNVLISGSWDSTIRVWDINDGACLDVIEDHGADVYGLACHTERPFMLVSTSRDSTVRLWSMLPLVSSLYMKILVSRPLSEIFSPTVVQGEDLDESLGLYGAHSKNIKELLLKNGNHSSPGIWQAVSSLFCPSSGTANLWDLIDVLRNRDVDFFHYKTGIVHRKHVIKLTTAKAVEKELANVSFFGSGVSVSGKEENVQKAAEYHLLTGNLKKYCELKIQLGEWLEALALAPGVSVSYWRELTTRWLNLLKEENSEIIAPLYIAANKPDGLIKHYVKHNFMEKAYIVSVAASEGLLSSASVSSEDKVDDKIDPKTVYDQMIKDNLRCLSERYLVCGYPVRAACWHLSNGDIQDALYCLLRGHELELAMSICLSLGVKNSSFHQVTVYLAWRCVYKGEWELALEILNLGAENHNEKIKICINCGLSLAERNALHQKAGLPSVEKCRSIAEEENQNNGSIVKIVQFYMLSDEKRKGLNIGLNYVKDNLNDPRWRLDCVWQILYTMSCISDNLLQDISYDRHRLELQIYCAYVGALIAIRQGYYPIVTPLFSTTLSLMRRVHNLNFAIAEDTVSSEMHAWVVSKNSTGAEKGGTIYKEMMYRVSEDIPFGDIGVTIVSGSNLPRHSDHHRCYLRGSTIQGPVYFLDDTKSAISLNDALMWAKVNRFSPLKTGLSVVPF